MAGLTHGIDTQASKRVRNSFSFISCGENVLFSPRAFPGAMLTLGTWADEARIVRGSAVASSPHTVPGRDSEGGTAILGGSDQFFIFLLFVV